MDTFHENAGKNIELCDGNRTAAKIEKREMKNSIVFSKKSLINNVVFSVKIEDTKFQSGSDVSLGVMYCDPRFQPVDKECMSDQLQDGIWLLHGKGLYLDGERRGDYPTNIKVATGDVVGVMRTRNGTVHFFKNGEDQGQAFDHVPEGVWAVVGLEWLITKVSVQSSEVGRTRSGPTAPVATSISRPTRPVRHDIISVPPRPPVDKPSPVVTRAIGDALRPRSGSVKSTPTPAPKVPEERVLPPGGRYKLKPFPNTKLMPSPSSPALGRKAELIKEAEEAGTGGIKTCRSLTSLTDMQDECPYRTKCLIVKDKLRLHSAFFDPSHDTCFCRKCYLARGDNSYYTRGEPPRRYGLPIGWYKFGLRTPAKAESMDVFKKWHVAFHGTKPTSLNSILNTGDLLMPGDITIEGEEVRPPPNHFDDKSDDPLQTPPVGHDVRKIYLSPSIKYAGCEAYAPAFILTDPTTLEEFDARVALQVRILPTSYEVKRETIGAGAKRIDDMFSNLDLEWATRRRGAIVLVGFLVKVEGYDDKAGPSTTDLCGLRPRITQR